MTESDRELTYLFVGKGGTLSVDPESADIIRNMVHMDHLVGTLLKEKYGNSGRTEPYLAERWDTSPDGLTWDFYLHKGLRCEDGTSIDAPAFVHSFTTILRIYAKRDDLAAFNRLKGWQKFKTSNTALEGIQAPSADHLRFIFDTPPDGFPEFLAMSFYGFYCPSNFDNGRWKNPKQIVSSGPYALEPGSIHENELVLKRRDDFPLISKEAPEQVLIRTVDAHEALQASKKQTLIYYRQNDGGSRPDGFNIYKGAPIFLTALVLSPFRHTAFDRIEHRKQFREAIYQAMAELPVPKLGISDLYPGHSFYLSANSATSLPKSEPSSHAWKPKEPLKILRLSYSSKDQGAYTEEIVTRALKKLGWPYEMLDPDFKDPTFIKRRNTNREYDIRFATVDIGGSAENWVINMMFCSQLAISFPDPSGKMCELVKDHEGRSGRYNQAEYLSKFEKIVAEDSAVVPLYHTGSYWLVSPDINPDQVLAPTLVVPRFDKLRFK